MTNIPGHNEEPGKQPEGRRDVASFVGNGGGHSANPTGPGSAESLSGEIPPLIDIPAVTLPKGGGAMKGIDEKFTINSANGTATCAIPLPFSKGRDGISPDLSLIYNSGSGNSAFGLGWTIGLPFIQRRTEKELPQYRDAEESDTFIFSGAEDMVPVLVQNAQGKWIRKTAMEGTILITYYRPRIEMGFARIERLDDGGNIYWRVRTKDNAVLVFGLSDDAKLFSPVATEGKDKVFQWFLEYSYDDKGHFILYTYKKENKDNIVPSVSEKNHLNDLAPFTNIYCKSIQYGNTTAWYADGDGTGAPGPGEGLGTPVLGEGAGTGVPPTNFLFELVFDYGEHDLNNPKTAEITTWPVRQDAFSDFRAGFEIRTYRLCRRVLMFHHFKEELGWDDYLVRSLDLTYDQHPHLTYLSAAEETGYSWNTDGTLGSRQSIPPYEFSYFKPGFSQEVQEISTDNIANAPVGLDNKNYQWTDLYSEGIAGILSEQAGGLFYKENLGSGTFSPAQFVSPRPSFTGLQTGSLAIQDLEADGRKYLVSTQPGLKGYYSLNQDTEEGWLGFHSFEKYPNIDLKDPNLRFLDLNGDGMPDMLLSLEQEFIWYAAKGKIGYDDYHFAARAADEEKGPQIVFADKDEKLLIATADMSGDGLADIVLITYAQVCYYPNLGYGRFGARVTMDMNGGFDNYAGFNPEYLLLGDIDGSGTTDIVYTGNGNIQVWFNQSGNSLSDPSLFFNPFPDLDNQSKLSLVDLLGTGVACLVWSSSLPSASYAPLRYIDLMGGRKPHILYSYKNNTGKEVTLEYRSSTQYYLEDKLQGIPWVTRLPFPVLCVSKVILEDKVAQTRFTYEYRYRHGYYDAKEREFRGFAMVEQRDTETYEQFVKATGNAGAANTTEKDFYQPAAIIRTWYHTGAWLHRDQLFHQLQDEYFPQALIATGQLDDTSFITGQSDYFLDESAVLPDGIEASGISECYRSLKGLPLRQEIYSDHGDEQSQLLPYTVKQYNYDLQLLQPQAGQRYAVLMAHEKEILTFDFEREPLDPRISHTIHVELDPYGNVLQSASIVYGRKKADPALPTDGDRQQQARQYILYKQHGYTTPIDTATAYRLPAPCESQTWELNAPTTAKNFFLAGEVSSLFATSAVVLYEQTTLVNQKRKLRHAKIVYLKNDLTGPMAFGTQDTLALPYESYSLVFTPTLTAAIYGGKFDDGRWRNKALYVQFQGDQQYWLRSGRLYFHPDLTATPDATTIPPPSAADVAFAHSNFFMAVAYEDNTGNLSKVFYDPFRLFIQRMIDPLDNELNVDAYHYRNLQPYILRDMNDNRTAVRFDALGRVTHTFVMGKQSEFKGDPIDLNSTEFSSNDQPTTILEYDFRYYSTNGALPDVVKSSVRESHYYADPLPAQSSGGLTGWLKRLFGGGTPAETPAAEVVWQTMYSYSDGSGHEVLKKMQAEPGLAPQRDANGALLHDSSGYLLMADTTPALRWVGNGKTIFNNKGNPVKIYENYFDSSYEYNTEEELVEIGFTSIFYYDALDRLIGTDHPNGTFTGAVFDAWMEKSYDENDMVTDSDWYAARINGALGEAEQEAAQKAAVHYNTPVITYLDSLGRPFLSAIDNKTQRSNETIQESFFYTRRQLDVEGNVLSITDARGNVVMSWKYDMLGSICYQHSMDAGDRWLLADVMGKPVAVWDSRLQLFTYEYDGLHRALNLLVNTGAGDKVYEQYRYGEGLAGDKSMNLRGKIYQHYDTAGLVTNQAFDFKGNKLGSTRSLLKDYTTAPDWSANPTLEAEVFSDESAFDALNRPIQLIAVDGSIFTPVYNEANLLNSMAVKVRGAATATSFIVNIDYNAKGQREQIAYGNNTTTQYEYDPQTYRLIRLLTTGTGGNPILQDLRYTYDPVGNITRQSDNAQKTVFYGGQQIGAQNDYIYDAVYRLVEAAGREHTGQIGSTAQDNWNDAWCQLSLQPNSPVQLRNYTQKYFYDGVGNILKMQHIAGGSAGWTRAYSYNAANNQLTQTVVGSQRYSYSYNVHGSMLTMPQLQTIDWNFREEMQHAGLGGGGDAWYVYDSSGQRTRKVIVKQGNKTADRLYLGPVEIYRERTGNSITLERATLHIMDDQRRVAIVDTRTKGNDGNTPTLTRYQYADHLGSSALELDETARVITYEEYHPYGTTAYQATDASRQVPAKRYRYIGMERDDESGLNYHQARYYIPWLGRWTAVDPTGVLSENILYSYCSSNPVTLSDRNGRWPTLSGMKKSISDFRDSARDAVQHSPTAQTIAGGIYGTMEAFSPAGLPTPPEASNEFEKGRAIGNAATGIVQMVEGVQGMIAGGGMVLGGGAGEVVTVGVGTPIAVPVAVAGAGIFALGAGFTTLGAANLKRAKDRWSKADERPSAAEKPVPEKPAPPPEKPAPPPEKPAPPPEKPAAPREKPAAPAEKPAAPQEAPKPGDKPATDKPAPGKKPDLKVDVEPGKKVDRSLLNKPKKPGEAPTFKKDNTKVEIHHEGQNPDGPFSEKHWEDHRGKGNDKINHPDKGKPSKVDRKQFNQDKKEYWKQEHKNWPTDK